MGYSFNPFSGNLDKIGESSTNTSTIWVQPTGINTIENGLLLLEAITLAYASTPNNLPLSSTNRAVVYVLAGTYDIGNNTIIIGQYVDIIGLGDAKDIIINRSTSSTTITISVSNDFVLQNLTIDNSSGTISLSCSSTINGNMNNIIFLKSMSTTSATWAGIYTNIICSASSCFTGDITGTVKDSRFLSNSCGFKTSGTLTISGTVDNCIGTTNCFGSSSSSVTINISGVIKNCTAQGNSYGRSSSLVTISGILINCIMNGDGNSFGYSDNSTVTISGKIINCIANSNFADNFGRSNLGIVNISGLISNCKDTGYRTFGHSFGNTVTISGIIENCSAGYNSFGAGFTNTVNITGTIKDCHSAQDSFGYKSSTGTLTISGTISDCVGTSNCFGSVPSGIVSITTTAIISDCVGTSSCFGMGSTITNQGLIKGCIATTSSFGDTTSTGKIVNCTRTGAYGSHSGTIENCNFSDNSASSTITLNANAKVKYSTIYQAGAGECFESSSGAINASVYQCSANKSVENSGNITNLISTPYNVIDTDISI